MKKISVVLAVAACFLAEGALANGVVKSLTGTAQVQLGSAAPHALRVGDEVKQGETISTGANSSVVVTFTDGEVAALTSNTRMTVSQYEFNPQSGDGKVQLSLLSGGMRAVTGQIGKKAPEHVSYKAGAATIGVHGTDTNIIATPKGDVVVTVNNGEITFTQGDHKVTVSAGQALSLDSNGAFQQGAIQQILAKLPSGEASQLTALNGVQGVEDAIRVAMATTKSAGAGAGAGGAGGDGDGGGSSGSSGGTVGNTGMNAGAGAGGGRASGS